MLLIFCYRCSVIILNVKHWDLKSKRRNFLYFIFNVNTLKNCCSSNLISKMIDPFSIWYCCASLFIITCYIQLFSPIFRLLISLILQPYLTIINFPTVCFSLHKYDLKLWSKMRVKYKMSSTFRFILWYIHSIKPSKFGYELRIQRETEQNASGCTVFVYCTCIFTNKWNINAIFSSGTRTQRIYIQIEQATSIFIHE